MYQVRPEFRIPLPILLGFLAISCENPVLHTEHNTLGAPEVTTVLILSEKDQSDANRDGVKDTNEVATFCGQAEGMKVHRGFCKTGDNGEVLAANPVMNANPAAWFARVVFSELLNPAVEELIPAGENNEKIVGSLLNTQPVEVICGGRVIAYDGFYDPSGNDVTQRPGPALIIQPTAQVATGSECFLTVKPSVVDKDGFQVDAAFAGPFRFGIAAMDVGAISPEPGAESIALDATFTVAFNAVPDIATLTNTTMFLVDAANPGTPIAVTRTLNKESKTTVTIKPDAPLAPATTYKLIVAATGIKDAGGGSMTLAAPREVGFQTVPAPAPVVPAP